MQVGDTVGTFRLEREVARGGMGAVWQARDAAGGIVAIKLVLESDPVGDARFAREAALLGGLAHPNIVRYIAHGTHDDGPWLAMEWLDAEPLSDRIRSLSIADVVAVGRQVADALAAAHRVGVVHRDIKPSNILLAGGSIDAVRVIDFGIARIARDNVSALTRTGFMVGTPGYAAPEQIKRSQDVDARSDVFALGCVLYLGLTGTPAFYASDHRASLARTLYAEPTPITDLVPDAPTKLVATIERMLRKNPDLRPADGAAVFDELSTLAHLPTARPTRKMASDVPTQLVPASLAAVVIGWGDDDEDDTDAQPTPQMLEQRARVIAEIGAVYGVVFDALVDGAFAATIAVDQAKTLQNAARCALAIADTEPMARIAIVTGDRDAAGDLVDRACREVTAATVAGMMTAAPRGMVRADGATAVTVGGGRAVPSVDDLFDLE
jgi:serine/threonine protein kinase